MIACPTIDIRYMAMGVSGLKMNTVIKFGSLAFDVASDDKVRELLGLVHNGAKRRGFYGQPLGTNMGGPPQANVPAHWPRPNQPIPFAPGKNTQQKPGSVPAKPAPKEKPPEKPVAQAPNFGKWMNMDSAKKVMGYASTLNDLLNRK